MTLLLAGLVVGSLNYISLIKTQVIWEL